MSEHLDGCALDFAASARDDAETAAFLASLLHEERVLGETDMASGADLATWLRRDPFLADRVVEVPGWRTRGRGPLNAKGGVNHHTAGPTDKPTARTPSLRIVIEGRADLTGPLANLYLGFDRKVRVIAAGSANHAGLPDGGVCRGMHGNSEAYGLEIEHPGTFPLPPDMVKIVAHVWAAVFKGAGLPASQLVQHWEWAPSRKIDLATNMHSAAGPAPSANAFRSMIAAAMEPPPRRWRVELRNKSGEAVLRSEPTGDAGLESRFRSFTGREDVRDRFVSMAKNGKGPRIVAVEQ